MRRCWRSASRLIERFAPFVLVALPSRPGWADGSPGEWAVSLNLVTVTTRRPSNSARRGTSKLRAQRVVHLLRDMGGGMVSTPM